MTEVMERPQSTLPLSVRAVDKAAGLLAGRGFDRRRFLYRLAVVGSALAIDPLKFLTRPTPAYASVCGSGNSCAAGWSVFCCTINKGANTCPSGSYVAGWWKVDASAFCLGSPRYYIDCNRRPGSTCRCRCNSTGCDHRRVCCNVFRYGQCNTQIGGVTEVVCRLITCTPPWKWDPSCGRTVRTDPETRSHTSRCLPPKRSSRITLKYQDLGLVGSVVGRPETRERDAARGGRKRRFTRGMILWHRSVGAHEVHGSIAKRYRELRAERGPLGYPRTDQQRLDGGGAFNRFERGSIYKRSGLGTHAVTGKADQRFRRLGGPKGKLGFPVRGTRVVSGGQVTTFQNGVIYVSADTGPVEVMDNVLDVLRSRGGIRIFGFPMRSEKHYDNGGMLQDFQRGFVAGAAPTALYAVRSEIEQRYRSEGFVWGSWGYPTSHTRQVTGATTGFESDFQTRTAYWSAATQVRWLGGAILSRYRAEGGPAGALGFPTSDVVSTSTTTEQATFEHGTITHDRTTGTTQVVPAGTP